MTKRGEWIAFGSLLTEMPLLLLALGAAHHWSPPGWAIEWLIPMAAIGLMVSSTAGAQYAASTSMTHSDAAQAPVLRSLAAIVAIGEVYIVVGYLMSVRAGVDLETLLPGVWLWLWITAVPSIALLAGAAALVSDHVINAAAESQKDLEDRAGKLEEDLSKERSSHAQSRRELEGRLESSQREGEQRIGSALARVAELELEVATARSAGGRGQIKYEPLAIECLRDAGVWLTGDELLDLMAGRAEGEIKMPSLAKAAERSPVISSIFRPEDGVQMYAAKDAAGALPEAPRVAA